MKQSKTEKSKLFFAFVNHLRKRTSMYVHVKDFSSLSSIIVGFDIGSQSGTLTRLKNWLAQEYGTPTNTDWIYAIFCLADLDIGNIQSLTNEEENQAIEKMFELLSTYEIFLRQQEIGLDKETTED